MEWIAHTLHQTHGGSAGIRVAPFYGRWMRGKVVSFAGNRDRPFPARATWTRAAGSLGRSFPGICGDRTRGSFGEAGYGYYEVHKQVCIDSRRSRLLWGSGNARQNRMGTGCEAGTGFPNPDSANVGVLENRSIGLREPSGSPTASTGGDARCAMPLSWMGGNVGTDRTRSGDSPVGISTAGGLGTGFAANPQMRVDCGGQVSFQARARTFLRRPRAKTASPARMMARVESRILATARDG